MSYVQGDASGEPALAAVIDGADVVVGALQPEDGGETSGADYALGSVDVIERGNYHRAHIKLGY